VTGKAGFSATPSPVFYRDWKPTYRRGFPSRRTPWRGGLGPSRGAPFRCRCTPPTPWCAASPRLRTKGVASKIHRAELVYQHPCWSPRRQDRGPCPTKWTCRTL